MRFEWDERKNRRNLKKHGVPFDIAAEVFSDPLCITIEDRAVGDEDRHWTIGCAGNLVILVVVHLVLDDAGEEVIRVISARKATPRERHIYEKGR